MLACLVSCRPLTICGSTSSSAEGGGGGEIANDIITCVVLSVLGSRVLRASSADCAEEASVFGAV